MGVGVCEGQALCLQLWATQGGKGAQPQGSSLACRPREGRGRRARRGGGGGAGGVEPGRGGADGGGESQGT